MRVSGPLACLAAVACVALSPAAFAAANDPMVGVTTAATLVSTGTPPQRAQRILEVGTDMFAKERVATSESGIVHLMFRDGSSMTVGPNSDLTLDEYVYDPNARTGKIAFSVAKGVFRYVGGRISKNTPVQFRTPVATLGIRGGINQFTVNPATRRVTTTHIFGFGTTIAIPTGNGGSRTETIGRQEFQAVIGAGGVLSITRLSVSQFQQINRSFQRPPGVALAGLPAAGGAGQGPVAIPAVGNLGAGGGLPGFSAPTFIAIPKPVQFPAFRSFAPPPPAPITQPSKNIGNIRDE